MLSTWLTIDEAAKVAGAKPENLRDLVLTGHLSCLIVPEKVGGGRERFDPEELAQHRETMHKIENTRGQRRTLDVGDALRAYLEEHPPLLDYDQALADEAPVLAKSKNGTVFAHVQDGVLAAFANRRGWANAGAAFAVRETLKSMGAIQVRGIRPLEGGKQRWQIWWRIPLTFWSATPELAELIASINGTRQKGEEVKSTRAQGVYLAEPMQAID